MQKKLLLNSPWFIPIVFSVFVLGNACDLFGTYIAQPHFESEANWIYLALRRQGIYLGWPGAILGKTVLCLVCLWGLRVSVARRRTYFLPPGHTFREVMSYFFFGRILTWAETFYRLPRDWRPLLCMPFIGIALGGLYFAYLGYANVADIYHWPRFPGHYIRGFWVEDVLLVYAVAAVVSIFWLIWQDYQSVRE